MKTIYTNGKVPQPDISALTKHRVFKKKGRCLRSDFSSPKVTKKFMYTLVAKHPVSEIRSLECGVEISNKERLLLYMTAVHITVDAQNVHRLLLHKAEYVS
jgi:hypothetical protein